MNGRLEGRTYANDALIAVGPYFDGMLSRRRGILGAQGLRRQLVLNVQSEGHKSVHKRLHRVRPWRDDDVLDLLPSQGGEVARSICSDEGIEEWARSLPSWGERRSPTARSPISRYTTSLSVRANSGGLVPVALNGHRYHYNESRDSRICIERTWDATKLE